MLIAIFAVLSALFAAGICAIAGGFESLGWIWILPLCLVVGFLILLALWYLLILIMTKCVDMEKEQEKDSAFYRWVVQWTVESVIPLLGVRVHTKGFDQKIPKGRFLLVCNHLHDIDPAFLLRAFPKSQLAFIAKREVTEMFIVGPVLKKLLGQFVNRENDREALKTILKCIQIIKEDKASIAVFPEGYIHPDKKLHHFRPGVFKIATKTKVPIAVCTLRNTRYVLDRLLHLKPSTVEVRLLQVIYPEEYEDLTTVELSDRIYQMMADDLGPELVSQEENA